MHLDGYGCPATNAISYGLACMELEAGDSDSAALCRAGLTIDVLHLPLRLRRAENEWLQLATERRSDVSA